MGGTVGSLDPEAKGQRLEEREGKMGAGILGSSEDGSADLFPLKGKNPGGQPGRGT